jgi:hypothetical protein
MRTNPGDSARMRSAVLGNRAGILTYGITPPRQSYAAEKLAEVAMRQITRISQLPIDALVIYDIQDESLRTHATRPFPYQPCVDPARYAFEFLADLRLPKVVYRSVAAVTRTELSETLGRVAASDGLAVLVGAASRLQNAPLTLNEAYALARDSHPQLPIGGVLIAERHEQRHAEHERALQKMDAGCRYFISQGVYSVVASKNLLSDLYYLCQSNERPMPPILVTLSPCGSTKTLEFMSWLGISVPRWLENDLRRSKDILQTSIKVCADVLEDLHDFAQSHGIPLGCNVESVSLSKVEIEASVELVKLAARCLGRPTPPIVG